MEVTLAPIQAIPEGEGRTFQIGTEHVAVFRDRQGAVFATQATCPHRGGPLADGLIGGGSLICPLHSLKFDLKSGLAQNGECSLKVYPARLNSTGHVVIEL
ncbi:MAG TPA: Rieske (2Fe-2S) protein [Polyangiaceae bacterium]|nr:Rieske (2Fe-2S) protein [Polyangiaceae bacterium]